MRPIESGLVAPVCEIYHSSYSYLFIYLYCMPTIHGFNIHSPVGTIQNLQFCKINVSSSKAQQNNFLLMSTFGTLWHVRCWSVLWVTHTLEVETAPTTGSHMLSHVPTSASSSPSPWNWISYFITCSFLASMEGRSKWKSDDHHILCCYTQILKILLRDSA